MPFAFYKSRISLFSHREMLYEMDRNSVNNGPRTGQSIGRAERPMAKCFGLDALALFFLSVRPN